MPTIKYENTDALNAILTVEIAKADYLDKVNDKLKEYRKKASVKGFRPGKVPMGMIKSRYGTEVLIEEVDGLLATNVNNYINDNKLKTIGQPLPIEDNDIKFSINKPIDFTFQFELGLAPDFEMQGINLDNKLPYYDIVISDEQVQEEVDTLRSKNGDGFEEGVVDVIESDMLVISLAEMEGEAIKEGGVTRDETYLALRDVANAELKDNLLTATIGDAFDIDIFSIEDKPEEHIRKHILAVEDDTEFNNTFRLTVKEIKRVKKAELNEEFFKKIFPASEIKTEEEFKEQIATEIAKSYKQASLNHFKNLVFDDLIVKNEMELPLEFLEKWLKFNNKDLAVDFFDGKEFVDFQKSMRWNLIRETLAEEYKAEVSMEDVEAMVRTEIMQYFNYQVPAYGEMMDGMVERMLSDKNEVRRRFDMLMDDKVLTAASENIGKDFKTVSKDEFENLTKEYNEAKKGAE